MWSALPGFGLTVSCFSSTLTSQRWRQMFVHLFRTRNGLCWFVGASQVALVVKNPPTNAGDPRDAGSTPGGRNGNPLQYSCLENPMDGGAWWAAVHGVTKSQTRLKWLSSSSMDYQKMATHFSILVWKIPWTEEPGGLQSMGSQRVRHNLVAHWAHYYYSCHY